MFNYLILNVIIELIALTTLIIADSDDLLMTKERWNWIKDDKNCSKVAYGNSAKDPSLRCYWINDKMTIFKMEVVNRDPLILRYHELVHRRKCKRIIEASKSMNIKQTAVVGNGVNNLVASKGRNANGTWVAHHFPGEINDMFNVVQRAVLAYDLDAAELFQVKI
ncbi:hypothetical protein WR25_24629 isoform C [Diploscapter pachys]|uniref:Uncharacterized protein n=1 Tax=Diploscapter pachys TaxID=2018661 RepID=A0A2A2JZH0_9BILA|nr:hypothetical protein WR25_24629 isoform C [Diploscapter pachys]